MRLRVADRSIIAPVGQEEVTLDAGDVTVELDFLLRDVVAETDEGTDADVLTLAGTLVSREGRIGQERRDQGRALGVVQRKLAIASLRGLTVVIQEFAVNLSIAQGVQLIAGFTVQGHDLDGRDQRLVQHTVFEGVTDVDVQTQALGRIVRVQVGTPHAFEADQTRVDARIRTPAIVQQTFEARWHTSRTDTSHAAGAQGIDGDAVRTGRGDRIALRLAGDRVDVVFAEAEAVGLAARELTVAQGQFVAVVVLNRTGGAPAITEGAARQRQTRRATVAVGVGRLVALGFEGQAVNVLAGLDIDHTGNGVRAIDRRGTVTQDFHAVDHRGRQDVQVGSANRATRTGRRHAAAVKQHQGTARAHAPQTDGVGTRPTVGDEATIGIVDLRRTAGDGGRLQGFRGRGEALQGGFFARHDLGRRRSIEVVAADARTNDDDFLDRRCLFFSRGRFLSDRNARSQQS